MKNTTTNTWEKLTQKLPKRDIIKDLQETDLSIER
jgi:hypothetical protein